MGHRNIIQPTTGGTDGGRARAWGQLPPASTVEPPMPGAVLIITTSDTLVARSRILDCCNFYDSKLLYSFTHLIKAVAC